MYQARQSSGSVSMTHNVMLSDWSTLLEDAYSVVGYFYFHSKTASFVVNN